jgi:inner membrane protein
MDSITQGLMGAVTAQLGFRQRIGRDATWVAALAAYCPDLDAFVSPLMSAFGVKYPFMSVLVHRGITHSLLLVPLISLLVAVVWWRARRRVYRKRAAISEGADPSSPGRSPPGFLLLYACVFIAVLTHPLLDWCTSYGTQLWAPLTNTRYAGDVVGIIDFIFTPLLIVTLLGCYLVRKILRNRSVRPTLAIGWVGFILSVGYLGAGRVMHDWAVEKARGLTGNAKILHANAYPIIGTIFLWRGVVETEDSWLITRLHRFSDPNNPPKTNIVPKQGDNIWIRRARDLREYQIYDWFAMGQLRPEYTCADGRHIVQFHDMRHAWGIDSERSLWPLQVTFDKSGQVVDLRRVMERHGRSLREFGTSIWREIWDP